MRAFAQGIGFGVVVLFSLYVTYKLVYRGFFSPLSSIPGPYLARFSIAWQLQHTVWDRFGPVLAEAHQKYGIRVTQYQIVKF